MRIHTQAARLQGLRAPNLETGGAGGQEMGQRPEEAGARSGVTLGARSSRLSSQTASSGEGFGSKCGNAHP